MAFAKAIVANAAGDALEPLSDPAGEALRHERKNYANNTDSFSLTQPEPVLDSKGEPKVRVKSSRAKAQQSSGAVSSFNVLASNIKDQWRRMTESGCDPFVRVTLRPSASKEPPVKETDVILGGGKSVEWTEFDGNELTFLLTSEPTKKYLNFEVFDKDIGKDDRSLGRAPIRLESVSTLNKQYYARLDLFQGKKWSGQIDVGARLLPYYPKNNNNSDNTTDATETSELAEEVDADANNYKYQLVVSVFSADDLEDEDTTLSEEENFWRFVKAVSLFTGYICLGALVFALIEEKSFGQMVWFFIVSCCTVGYGDWSPVTDAGHILNAFVIIINLFIFAGAFTITFNYIYAQQEALMRRGGGSKSLRNFATNYFVGFSAKLDDKLKETVQSEQERMKQHIEDNGQIMKADSELDDVALDLKKNDEHELSRSKSLSKTGMEREAKRAEQRTRQEAEEAELEAEQRKSMIINFCLLGGLMTAGTIFYAALDYQEAEAQKVRFEQIDDFPDYWIWDPIRFTVMTMTTVGYGDMYPLTPSGKVFGSFFIIVGVSFLTRIVGGVFDIVAARRETEQNRRTMERALLSANAMKEFDEDGSGDIDRYEFLKTMLIIRGEVGEHTVRRIMKRFEELDEDGSGEIDFADFAGATRRDAEKQEMQKQRSKSMDMGAKARSKSKSAAGAGVEEEMGQMVPSKTHTHAELVQTGSVTAVDADLGETGSAGKTQKRLSNVGNVNDMVSSDTEDMAGTGANATDAEAEDANNNGDADESEVPIRSNTDREMLGGDAANAIEEVEDSAQQYKD